MLKPFMLVMQVVLHGLLNEVTCAFHHSSERLWRQELQFREIQYRRRFESLRLREKRRWTFLEDILVREQRLQDHDLVWSRIIKKLAKSEENCASRLVELELELLVVKNELQAEKYIRKMKGFEEKSQMTNIADSEQEQPTSSQDNLISKQATSTQDISNSKQLTGSRDSFNSNELADSPHSFISRQLAGVQDISNSKHLTSSQHSSGSKQQETSANEGSYNPPQIENDVKGRNICKLGEWHNSKQLPLLAANADVGDALEIQCPYKIWAHWTVYVGFIANSEGMLEAQVINFGFDKGHGYSPTSTTVTMNRLEDVVGNCFVRINNARDRYFSAVKNISLLNERIRSFLKQNATYNFLFNNCESFTMYLRYGYAVSFQAGLFAVLTMTALIFVVYSPTAAYFAVISAKVVKHLLIYLALVLCRAVVAIFVAFIFVVFRIMGLDW